MNIASKKQYAEIKDVGKGAFGRCVLARNLADGSLIAVKEIKFEMFAKRRSSPADNDSADEEENAEMMQMIRDQGQLLRRLSHANVVKGLGSFEEDGIFYVITEYCDSGDLWRAILHQKVNGPAYFSENRILSWAVQLVLAINYIHENSILHRDIKPSNVFLHADGRIVKLGSFGIAKKLDSPDGFLLGQIGTMTHMSPEMIEGRAVTLKSDCWALGVTLYEVASLSLPFENASPTMLCRDICQKTPKPLSANRYSEPLRLLIEDNLLNKEAGQRPTSRQLISSHVLLSAISELIIENNWGFK